MPDLHLTLLECYDILRHLEEWVVWLTISRLTVPLTSLTGLSDD